MNRAKSICSSPGCLRLTDGSSRCAIHAKQRTPDTRPSRSQRGYTRRWYDHYQKPYLTAHPLCEECVEHGITKAAECVDHVTPHEGNEELLYCWANLRALCWSCHSRKTARESARSSNTPPGEGFYRVARSRKPSRQVSYFNPKNSFYLEDQWNGTEHQSEQN